MRRPNPIREDSRVSALPRPRVSGPIGNRPVSARSVLASALTGADDARLTGSELVELASAVRISDGAARTCLWRMVSNGEPTGHPLERGQRVVSLDRRSAADRLKLRTAATALQLAELRECAWMRPDNLDPQPLPPSRRATDICAADMKSGFR